jgi:hypothetical protein
MADATPQPEPSAVNGPDAEPSGRRQNPRADQRRSMSDAPALSPPLAVDATGAGRLCGGRSRSWWWSQWSKAATPIGFTVGGSRFWLISELESWMAAGAPPRSQWAARTAARDSTARLNQLQRTG